MVAVCCLWFDACCSLCVGNCSLLFAVCCRGFFVKKRWLVVCVCVVCCEVLLFVVYC